jgi:hypothetical protein
MSDTKKQYTYQRGTDGCDETFDISYPDGTHLVSIHFWEEVERAEREARLIVHALNSHNELIRQLRKLAVTVCGNTTFNQQVREAVQEANAVLAKVEGGAALEAEPDHVLTALAAHGLLESLRTVLPYARAEAESLEAYRRDDDAAAKEADTAWAAIERAESVIAKAEGRTA